MHCTTTGGKVATDEVNGNEITADSADIHCVEVVQRCRLWRLRGPISDTINNSPHLVWRPTAGTITDSML